MTIQFSNKEDEEKFRAANENINSIGELSDGYHTFNELYHHRHCLMLLAMMDTKSWISMKHDDGSSMEGWFLAGIELKTGMITYHLPIEYWDLAHRVARFVLDKAPKWDGHTSADVIKRIKRAIK